VSLEGIISQIQEQVFLQASNW